MRPYYLERWRIAKAHSERQMDFEDIVNELAGEENETEDNSKVEQVQSIITTGNED